MLENLQKLQTQDLLGFKLKDRLQPLTREMLLAYLTFLLEIVLLCYLTQQH